MNVLMLAPLPPPSGGIASWTVRYKEYCEINNISLRIVNLAVQGARASQETMHRNLWIELKRTIHIIRNLKKELKKSLPHVVHVNTSCSPLGVIRDALCIYVIHRKAPIVLHCRCNIEDQLGLNSISRFLFKYMVKKSDKVIVLNDFSKKYVDDIKTNKSVFIPNFVNEKKIDENHFIREDIKRVVYVGHVEKDKGFFQILDVAKLFPDISFKLVGAVREDVSNITIPSNVFLEGRVSMDTVQSYLRESDIFLFPSVTEGFSNALLEAMAMGIPAIATDVGANRQMIENQGGIIISENTSDAISNAIKKMRAYGVRKKMSNWNVTKVPSV